MHSRCVLTMTLLGLPVLSRRFLLEFHSWTCSENQYRLECGASVSRYLIAYHPLWQGWLCKLFSRGMNSKFLRFESIIVAGVVDTAMGAGGGRAISIYE